MRLIDANELLEWLKHWDKNLLDECAKDRIRQDTIEQMINQISFMPNLMWMPVSEGLPEDGEEVLVTENWEGVEPFTETAVHAVGMFSSVDNVDVSEHVTAWMRLPEPWEGEE